MQMSTCAVGLLLKTLAFRDTVEIWSQVALDTIVEMALRENLVHYRLQRTENGAYKLFVLPEDAPRAREILCQIERGEPPQ